MQLRHIKGNTYAFENNPGGCGFSDSASSGFSNSANAGLYVFNDDKCLMIDSGANQVRAQEILTLLGEKGWNVHAIFNTHAHADHCGGNHYFQENTHCRIYASTLEAAFINNPLLIPYTMYSAYPPQLLTGKFFMPQASRVSHIVKPGKVQINRTRFDILDLAGHSPGQLGIITPDGVLFAGDSLICPAILKANPFLYLADPGKHLNSLERIKKARYNMLYLSHSGLANDIGAVQKANEVIFQTIINNIKTIITKPCSLEAIIREIIICQGLQLNSNHYFRLSNSIAAFLSYLCNCRQARFYVGNNQLLYQVRG